MGGEGRSVRRVRQLLGPWTILVYVLSHLVCISSPSTSTPYYPLLRRSQSGSVFSTLIGGWHHGQRRARYDHQGVLHFSSYHHHPRLSGHSDNTGQQKRQTSNSFENARESIADTGRWQPHHHIVTDMGHKRARLPYGRQPPRRSRPVADPPGAPRSHTAQGRVYSATATSSATANPTILTTILPFCCDYSYSESASAATRNTRQQ